MYKNEIKFAEKSNEAACALDQLTKKKQLKFKELHKIVDACLEDKVSKKKFEQCVKGMILTGLVTETFTKDQTFRIALSSIGKEVHQALVERDNKHLATEHY